MVSVRDCDKEGAFIFLAKCVHPRIAAYSPLNLHIDKILKNKQPSMKQSKMMKW